MRAPDPPLTAQPTSTATAAATPTPTAMPTPTATLAPTPTAAPTPTPTPSAAPPATPTAAARAPYCAVADVLTAVRDYARHTSTALDWTHMVPETYVPPDLVSALTGGPQPRLFAVEALTGVLLRARRGDPAYAQVLRDDPNASVRTEAYADLAALRDAAARAGHRLVIMSAYRSYSLQKLTFNYWVGVGGYEQALRTSARPGHSEHQLGTVIDFGDGTAAPWEYDDRAATPTGGWLAANASAHGFVMSYPRGKTTVTCYDYEPWHYRWVGRELAAAVVASGRALREHQEISR